ncbi:MAG: hypothetical protein UU57_C0025G0002 [Candidatus Woesebacteria bacterium GW2011_GWE1_41_24]|uniref:Bacterial spore germination immunoglobulin-like domain-containing protein n=1 Tax=Candidatus Woesebacteria bacterium GW2011_GWE1_41_24 TaxID=1618597 RepID=A0A0G0VT07_9BACT|nr:MAG: hypothetical protein UU57_C0025G0002 [Candidatus Woesebacteria bacterium GW2011_GWE1_41_24]
MLKFLNMDPINPIAGNPEALNSPKNHANHWVTVLSVALFIISALGVIIFLTPTSTPVSTPSAEPSLGVPTVSSPSAGSKVKSPLKVTGNVPAGWMFEGTFPIRVLDSDKNVLAQVGAKEVLPGSWQSGEPVEFTATLTFRAATGSGTLVLENDNPSGDPANSRVFEIPIKF